MPLFEYRCNGCSRKFTALVGVVAGASSPACPRCGGSDLNKLVSRFSATRSEDDTLEGLAEMADPDDPSSMRKLMREMKSEFGDELGDDFEGMLESSDGDGLADEAGGD